MGRASRDGSMASSEDPGSLSGATSADATVDSAITGATSEVVRHFNFEDQDHERATSAGGKFNFEETIGAADYRFTGDMSMYNDRNMRTRRRLRKELKIRAWLMTFFNTFAVDRLKRQHMYDFEMCCCKAIFASSAFSMDEAVEAVEADLEHDFHHEMTAEDFSDSLFETVDMWTASVDIDEYVEFLRCLYLRITYEDEHGTHRFRNVEDVVALDARDKRSEVPLGDMPPDTDDKVKLAKLCRRQTKRHDDSDSDAREDSDDGDDAEHRDSFRAEPAPPPLRRRNSVQRPSRRASVSSIHLKHRHSDRGAHLEKLADAIKSPAAARPPRSATRGDRTPRSRERSPEPRRTQPPPRENRKTDYELYGTGAGHG